jgi:hypothetical protein
VDPRFKLRWCQPDKEKVSVIQTTDVEDDSTSESPPLKKARKEDFFSFLPPSTPTKPRTRNQIRKFTKTPWNAHIKERQFVK